MKKIIICLIVLTLLLSQTFAQTKKRSVRKITKKSPVIYGIANDQTTESPKLSPESQRRLDTFRLVWQTIKDNYFDQTFNGQNWENVKTAFEPRIRKSLSDKDTYGIIGEMINSLNRSHFSIIPPEVFKEINVARVKSKKSEKTLPDAEKNTDKNNDKDSAEDENVSDEEELPDDSEAKFGIGIELRLINGTFVVSTVEKDSAAEKSGLKTGFIIEKVNTVSLDYLLERIEFWSPNIKNAKKLLPLEIVSWFLNGEKSTAVNLTFLDENGQEKTVSINREKLNGQAISIGSDFPKQFLNFQTKSLSDEVGYIKFNMFAIPVIEKFCSALTEFKNKKALIIDLRGNIGGLIAALYGVTGMLSENSMDLGTQIYKVGSDKLSSQPKAKNFKGKIVILVDNLTISAAEIMSAAMQENDRALVVGDITAGEALPAISVKLPTKAVFVYPIANFQTHKGNFVEGKGVTPDIQVSLDQKLLLTGKDSQLEAALNTIKNDNAFPPNKAKNSAENKFESTPPPMPKPTPKPLPTTGNSSAPKNGSVGIIRTVPPAEPAKEIKDEKSEQVITDFIDSIGGADELNKLKSYSLKGSSEIAYRTLRIPVSISIYRQKPDKYSEIMKSEAIGEVREVYDGKTFFVQSDFGVNQEFPEFGESGDLDLFSPILNLLDKNYYKSLIYKGMFEREGKKVYLIEAVTAKNYKLAMAFEVDSKKLVSFAGSAMTISFDDYRKIENLTLPFLINREHLMKIELNEIQLNPNIDANNFTKKENCFDKPNE